MTAIPEPPTARRPAPGGAAEPADLLIAGADLVTMDAARPVVRDGAIAVSGGAIAWTGPAAAARSRFAAARTLDATGLIALPGLVDTHFHTAQQLLRGKIAELSRRRQLRLPIWRNYLIPFESALTEADVHLSAQVGYANALRNGTTCFAEAGGPHADQMARAAVETGIRGIVARSTMDAGDGLPPSMRQSTAAAIEANVGLVREWGAPAPDRRVGAWLALRQLMVCGPELWEAFAGLAAELGTRVHIHLAEGGYEVEYAAARWGRRPAEHLESLGFLSGRVHAAHSILLAEAEIDVYAARQVSVAHCPLGNFVIGPPKVPQMLRRGIRVGLGTDGAAGGSLDLFEAIRVSWVALQSQFGTPWLERPAVSLEQLLAMATLGGAEALGMGRHLGSLVPGKRADIVLVSPRHWDLQPGYDPVFTAARGITGRDVETVLVDGQIVVEHGALTAIDEQELRARLAERSPAIMRRFESVIS